MLKPYFQRENSRLSIVGSKYRFGLGVSVILVSNESFQTRKNNRKHIMLVHTVYFWLKSSLSEEDKQQFQDGVESLATIQSTEQVVIGTPAETTKRPVIDDTYDCALTVMLKDISAHDLYQDDPIHHKFIADCNHLWERVQVYDAD